MMMIKIWYGSDDDGGDDDGSDGDHGGDDHNDNISPAFSCTRGQITLAQVWKVRATVAERNTITERKKYNHKKLREIQSQKFERNTITENWEKYNH